MQTFPLTVWWDYAVWIYLYESFQKWWNKNVIFSTRNFQIYWIKTIFWFWAPFKWCFQYMKFCFNICCKMVMLMPSKLNIFINFFKRFEILHFQPKAGTNKMSKSEWNWNSRFTHSSLISSPQVWVIFQLPTRCGNKMHVLELQCHFWEDYRYVECISQYLFCKGEWWRSQKKWEGKTTTSAQIVFTEILVNPSLHSDGNHITGNTVFYCFWQHYRENFSMINRFSAIFPVCWPEPGFSLMLNVNILTLLLFSSCINKLSTGSGKRYLLLCFCCDNVKKNPC